MSRTITFTLGMAPMAALFRNALAAVHRAALRVRTRSMNPSAPDPEGLRRLALKLADLEPRR